MQIQIYSDIGHVKCFGEEPDTTDFAGAAKRYVVIHSQNIVSIYYKYIYIYVYMLYM